MFFGELSENELRPFGRLFGNQFLDLFPMIRNQVLHSVVIEGVAWGRGKGNTCIHVVVVWEWAD